MFAVCDEFSDNFVTFTTASFLYDEIAEIADKIDSEKQVDVKDYIKYENIKDDFDKLCQDSYFDAFGCDAPVIFEEEEMAQLFCKLWGEYYDTKVYIVQLGIAREIRQTWCSDHYTYVNGKKVG